jgi:hypothetical protein
LYEGEFQDGKRWGFGTVKFGGEYQGDVYKGSWVNDVAEGNGVKIWERFHVCK